MGMVEDTVNRIVQYGNKTGDTNEKVIRGAVLGAIDGINAALHNFVIARRDKTLSVSASAKTVTLPARCRRVKELGRYDATTDRLAPKYWEISEQEFNEMFGATDSLTSQPPTSENFWFFIDDHSDGNRVIRLVYPPDAAFTMMVTYYENLTAENAHLLEQDDLIYNGALIRLVSWFPKDVGVAAQLYRQGLASLKASRRSSRRTLREHVHPRIAAHNAIASGLVS